MANKKITELTELTTPVGADLFAIVDDTDTTTKKVTVSNLMTQAPVQTADISGFATTVSLGNHESLTSSVHGISAFGATLVDDADASAARTTLGLGTASTSATTDFSSAFFSTVTESTTARTLSDSDNGKVIVCTNTGQITITVPSGLTAGFGCTVIQDNTGQVTVLGSGATVNGVGGKNTTNGQYSALNIIPVGTNDYIVDGSGLVTPPFANSYSLNFDGTNDYLAINSTAQVYSFSAWVKPSSTITTGSQLPQILMSAGNNFLPGLGGNATGTFTDELIYVRPGNSGWFYNNSSDTLPNTGWSHIFFAWVSSSSTNSGNAGYDIWLDGVKVGNAVEGTPTTTTPFSLTSTTRIGSRGDGTRWYGGLVDEVAIWTTDVSADIATIYNSGSPDDLSDTNVVSTGPAHWWRMGDSNGGTGNVTDDGSLNVTATVNGATYSSSVP